MNYGIVIKILGNILMVEGLLMLPSLLVSVYYGQDDILSFIISILLTIAIGLIMSIRKNDSERIKSKEGLAIVSLAWVLVSFFGSLPFVLSGSIPSLIDAFFETVSGFTTTGSTVVNNIESFPKGILFWRSFTHWIGGMGILVFTIAIIPTLGIGGFQIFKAESPGPVKDKIVPKIKDTAKILYKTYIIMTLVEVVFLLFGKISLYEAIVHTFGTVGTGGFSTRSESIGAFNSTYIYIVVGIFMVLSGVNFSLYYALYKGKWREVLKNNELRLYIAIVLISTLLIGVNLYFTSYKDIGTSLRDSFFQTGSIITTTGYATADFDLWPTFSKSILFLLMFVGGCAGSTSGGMKGIRILVLFKIIKRQIVKIFHPRAVVPIKVDGKTVSDDTISGITAFFILYMFIFGISTVIVSLEGITLQDSASAVATTLGNIGPGFGIIGPTRTFSEFSDITTLFFSFLMLLGRLELFTIIALLTPSNLRNEI